MFSILPRSAGNVIGVKLQGKLTHEAYQTLIPLIEERIEHYGQVNLLFELDHFEGWHLMAALDDLLFCYRHRDDIARLALVLDSKEDRWAVLVDHPLGRIAGRKEKIFKASQAKDAWKWVEKGAINQSSERPRTKRIGARANTHGDIFNSQKLRYGSGQRVLILGATLPGLALAASLSQRGFTPMLAERQKRLMPPATAYELIWPVGERLIKALGGYTALSKSAQELGAYERLRSSGVPYKSIDFSSTLLAQGKTWCLPRTVLAELLATMISKNEIAYSHQLESIQVVDDGVEVVFEGESVQRFDVVISAQGPRSRLRKLLTGSALPRNGGSIGTWSMIWAQPTIPSLVREFRAKGVFIRLHPSEDKESTAVTLALSGQRLGIEDPRDAQPKDLKRALDRVSFLTESFYDALKNASWLGYLDNTAVHESQWLHESGRIAWLADMGRSSAFSAGWDLSLSLESISELTECLHQTDIERIPLALKRWTDRRASRWSAFESAQRKMAPGLCIDAQLRSPYPTWLPWLRNPGAILDFWKSQMG
ncbi:MAG TPA: STAS/SEC14 domain-containing protein [Opitutales bacterium]|nr:STAS/SEC14 domain-containing protein [Opitutales bacterium]